MRLPRSVTDAATGELKWVTKVDDHPNATIIGAPSLFEDRLFVPVSWLEVALPADPNYACCTFRGSLVALNTGGVHFGMAAEGETI